MVRGFVVAAVEHKSVDWRARDARFLGRLAEPTVKAILQRTGVLLSAG
jgi:hypothetical protein